MKPDFPAQTAAAKLSKTQSTALSLLHLTQGTRQYRSGVQWNTFHSLDALDLAREVDGSWYLTPFGADVQAVVRAT